MPNRLIVRDFKASATNGSAISAAGTVDTVTSNGGSMLAWMKVSSFLGDTFAGFYDSTGVFEAWRLNIESGTGYPFLWTVNIAGSGTVNPKLSTPVPTNQWFRIAIVQSISGGVITGAIYINGVLSGTATRNSDVRSNSRFSISNSSVYKRAGVAVYERALTAQEITDDYFSGKIPTGAKINWSCQEGAGDAHYDSSGNGNNGTGGTLTWTSDVPMKARKLLKGNLVTNGDFEYAPPTNVPQNSPKFIDGTATGSSTNDLFEWHAANLNTNTTVQFDNAVKHSGNNSLKVVLAANGAYAEIRSGKVNGTYQTPLGKGFELKPSTQYRLSGWIKTANITGDSNNGASINVLEAQGDGTNNGGNGYTSSVKIVQDWTQYIATFTTQPNTVRGHVELRIYGHTGAATLQGSFWFDDIDLREV